MEDNKIPKIIHYCWFGRGEKPKLIKKCIASFSEMASGYKLIEWNEDNFDVNINKFVSDAYKNKKYAFVSDYVRAYVLYNYGGIYLDTDVELFKNFDEFLKNDTFWGIEVGDSIATSTIGAKKNSKLIKEFLDLYENRDFINKDGSLNQETNVVLITRILKEKGAKLNGDVETLNGIAKIYNLEIFSPYDYRTFQNYKNDTSVCMHHYYKSWMPWTVRIKQSIKKILIKVFGVKVFLKVKDAKNGK